MSSFKTNPLIPFLSWILFSSNLLHALEGGQQKPTLAVVKIGGGSNIQEENTLKDINNYAELKHDSRASLPSSFTICVSVLATTENRNPMLFNILGNDGSQWFSAVVRQIGDFVGKKVSRS